MTDITTIKEMGSDVLTEPGEYFEKIKAATEILTEEQLTAQLNYIFKEIERCKRIGQTVMAEKLEFAAEVIVKERALLELGITKYVYEDVLRSGITQIKPRNSVKIIELERYQRLIPEKNAEEIAEVRRHNLFDEYIIVFTDLTNQNMVTARDKKFIERNRDPVCFGIFKDVRTGDPYHRAYLITDWEDDFCDLTWEKVVQQVSKDSVGEISDDLIEGVVRLKKMSWWQKARTAIRNF